MRGRLGHERTTVPTLNDKMRLLPETFRLRPEERRSLRRQPDLALPDPLGCLVCTDGYRPGDNGRYWSVPDVLSLSCLQWLLDRVRARTVITLE